MTREDLKLPTGTTFTMGATIGRFSSAIIAALVPGTDQIFVVDEVPNYHYVGNGEIELLGTSPTQWAHETVTRWKFFAPTRAASAWISEDSVFDKALKRTKLSFHRNVRRKPETRTEIAREFFNERRVFLAPWLVVLPHELYKAKWPPEASGKGNERLAGQDYTLSALEHILSRRPRPRRPKVQARSSFLETYLRENRIRVDRQDAHMGRF